MDLRLRKSGELNSSIHATAASPLGLHIQKIHATTGKPAKVPNSPVNCFIVNDDVNGMKVPSKLDKQWYINLAEKRIEDFGGGVAW